MVPVMDRLVAHGTLHLTHVTACRFVKKMRATIVYLEKVCSRSTLDHLDVFFSISIVKAIRVWPRDLFAWALRLQTFLEQTIVL